MLYRLYATRPGVVMTAKAAEVLGVDRSVLIPTCTTSQHEYDVRFIEIPAPVATPEPEGLPAARSVQESINQAFTIIRNRRGNVALLALAPFLALLIVACLVYLAGRLV